MKVNDALLGLVLIALAAAVGLDVRTYPAIPGQNVGPGAFPGLIAALLAVCGVLLVIRGVRQRDRQSWVEWMPWMRSPRQLLAFAVTIGALLFTILCLDALGFIVCAAIVLLALFATLRVRWSVAVPVALVVALGIHTIFYFGLRVPLPWGVLQPIAW
ncbi:MAG: tripartite tricarboxylate transporter TctB family protein [Burkholderiaceae bacterium]